MTKHKLQSKFKNWEILGKGIKSRMGRIGKKRELENISDEIVKILLSNRGIKTKEQRQEFLNLTQPEKVKLWEAGIDEQSLKKAIKRIKTALKNKEKAIIFGDYDVDGVTSSAILWEYLYKAGLDVVPYIPERFSEGYGIKIDSISKLKEKHPELSLIITVDNGIVANDAVSTAKKFGIDVIIIDHHESGEKYPEAYTIVHTTKLCAAGISWFFVREFDRVIHNPSLIIHNYLELAALGTIADQMPLMGINRSIVKYGLEQLNVTQRVGLLALYQSAGIEKGNISVYEINYIIAPRLNAMGRLENAVESLRLLCTNNRSRAIELAGLLNRTNTKRQKIVDEVVTKVKLKMGKKYTDKIIVLEGDSYHEGVIGLAASKLTEEFWLPSIVISKGKKVSKGSARSIPGFSIISAIRSAGDLILGGGGHEMAAGFSIYTNDISKFRSAMKKYADIKLKSELLEKKLKIDTRLSSSNLTYELVSQIRGMEPFGIGNPSPSFTTDGCEAIDIRQVGKSGNHLKFKLKKDNISIDAISFSDLNNVSCYYPKMKLDIVYNLEENYWNGNVSLQLKVKDVRKSTT